MTEPAPPADAATPPTGRLPLLVWIVFGLSLLFGVFSGLVTWLTWLQIERTGLYTALAWSVLAVYAVTTVLYVAVGIFLLRRASWARWTGIVLAGVNIAIGLVLPLATGAVPDCLTLAPQIAILLILFRPEVVAWCRPDNSER